MHYKTPSHLLLLSVLKTHSSALEEGEIMPTFSVASQKLLSFSALFLCHKKSKEETGGSFLLYQPFLLLGLLEEVQV